MPTRTLSDVKGVSRYLLTDGIDNDRLHLHISEVGPGTRSHAAHTHDGREIFYVLEGSAEVEFGSERHSLKAGEAIQVDCEVPHGIRNAGDRPLRYAVIIAH